MADRIMGLLGGIGALLVVQGCGSSEQPAQGGTGGAGPSAGVTGTAGSPAAGAGGSATGGSGMGGAPMGGTAGSLGGSAGEPQAGSSGMPGGGMGGAAGAGGGASGSGGAAGATGTATFTVKSELASAVDPSAPTTVGIVTWSVDVGGLSNASIEFGLDTAYGMRAPVDLAEAEYRTLLLGMKPSSMYHFRIVAADTTTMYVSDDYVIETGAPTTAVDVGSFDVMDDAGRERGFIVTSYWRGDGSAVPFILDADGQIVWWYTGGPNGIARARMSADGKNVWMIAASNNGAALRRVTMDGLDAQTYNGTVGSHDITPVAGATMAFLEYGESDCDSIYEIDPAGTAMEVWESQGVVSSGGCHGNALRYSQAENAYTFSDVSQDIFVVGRSGTLMWRLSERVSGGNDAWGGTQHGHQLLDSSIVVFANVGGGQGISSFIEYDLQGSEIRRYDDGGFSQNLGDVQRLPGGNTLITYSNDGLIQEIDEDDNVVLEIDAGSPSFGYALWRETLYGEPPDIGQ